MKPARYFERLSAIVQSSEDAIISTELDGTITSWNPAAEILFDYTEEEAIGSNNAIIIPEELLAEEKKIISRIKKGGRVEPYETVRKRKNGNRFIISITVSPVKDDDGIITGASKIVRDITRQKQQEQKLAMLAAIIDSSEDAIISKTLDGIITTWNFGAEKIFGYTPEEAIGNHISLIIPEHKFDEEILIISKIKKGENLNHMETIRKTKDGRLINISLTVSPIKDKNGKIIGASKVARDITQKVELEEQRLSFTKKLQEINKFKDEFMIMASHELRTPLTVIKVNLQILESLFNGNSNVEFVSKTVKQVNKLANLISDLLDVSKIQTGVLELNFTDFDFEPFIKQIIDDLQQTVKTHKIIVKLNNNNIGVRADWDRLEQVIVNVVMNAVKYSPEADIVIVEVNKKDDEILVQVKDHGIGISQENIENVFTRFFRVRGLPSTFSGSGIGLYISSEIIKRHGGKIWVESEIEKGSTFYFTVPPIQC